jgi:hypothetical protein
MKLPRRQFLHLAAGAAALPAPMPRATACPNKDTRAGKLGRTPKREARREMPAQGPWSVDERVNWLKLLTMAFQ